MIKSKKILVVDDAAEIRQLVSATLDMESYTVLQASNAQKAIEIAKSEKPAVIIMDVLMPGLVNGIDAARQIKSDPSTQHCAILFLSGIAGNGRIEEAMKTGAVGYLTKPFSPLELIKRIESILGD